MRLIPCSMTLLLAGINCTSVIAADELEPYPKAEPGFTRQVIHLAEQPNEADLKVEILAGKVLPVDCNSQRLSGALEENNLEGWGYSYYRLESVQGPLSTLMACSDSSRKDEFVAVVGEGFLLRYNSKLPVVVYAPEDIEVRYRIWSASDEVEQAVAQ